MPTVNGQATGKVKVPDVVSNFSFRVVLVSESGVYGFATLSVPVRRDFNIVVDPPLYLFKDETLDLQVTVENNLPTAERVFIRRPKALTLTIPASRSASFRLPLDASMLPFRIEVFDAQGRVLTSRVVATKAVNPGLVRKESRSAYLTVSQSSELRFQHTFTKTHLPGNNQLKVCYKNSALGLILDALKELNRQPSGCFEQASSTNFPLVLALKILLKLPSSPETDKLREEMLKNLKEGIKLLLTYECKDGGGFEWFGKAPCHSTLTAYGLFQFLEIADLQLNLFDNILIWRLRNFLQSAKDQKGGFVIRQGLDALGNPDQDVSDLYIVFILAQRYAEFKDSFQREIDTAKGLLKQFRRDKESVDSYKLALLGLLYLATGDPAPVPELIAELISRQDAATGEVKKAKTSVTKSSGLSLGVETTALTLLLILRAKSYDNAEAIDRCLGFLTANLKNGAFSSTQATILSLLAFSEYLTAFGPATKGNTAFAVKLNGSKVGSLVVSSASLQSQCLDLSDTLRRTEAGEPSVEVVVASEKNSADKAKFLLSVDLVYYDSLPQSAKNSVLKVTTKTTPSPNFVQYEFVIRNTKSEDVGMTALEFVKPSCLEVNINDLDNLLLRGAINNYEFRDDNSLVVLYWRGIAKNASISLAFSAARRYAGSVKCVERASSLYLYYDKEGSINYFMLK